MAQRNPRTIHALQHVPHETMGALEDALVRAGVGWRTVLLFETPLHDLPWEEIAGLIVLGGPMNVDQVDTYPWLGLERDWIREAIRRDLPVLGICLGAQLLARSLGARVYPNGVKEIGWCSVQIVAPTDDPLFAGLSGLRTVFQWHGDTFDLPDGAVRLARSELCEQQAFRYRTKAYGLQFHVEVTEAMVPQWLEEPGNRAELLDVDDIDPDEIRHRLPTMIREMDAWGRHVLARFAAICRDHC